MAIKHEAPVGLVVEGDSEYHAVPELAKLLGLRHTTPANMQGQNPGSTAVEVARKALPYIKTQAAKTPRKVVLILDRENRTECAPEFAENLNAAIHSQLKKERYEYSCSIAVVVADRKFENWLIADVEGLKSHAFIKKKGASRQKSQVDGVDGEVDLCSLFSPGRNYRKGQMTADLAKRVRINESKVQRRSRSLRKLIKELKT